MLSFMKCRKNNVIQFKWQKLVSWINITKLFWSIHPHLFILPTSGKQFSIWREVTTFNFTCTCSNTPDFRKWKTYITIKTLKPGLNFSWCSCQNKKQILIVPLLPSTLRPTVSLGSPSSWAKNDSTLSSRDPSSTNRSTSACKLLYLLFHCPTEC